MLTLGCRLGFTCPSLLGAVQRLVLAGAGFAEAVLGSNILCLARKCYLIVGGRFASLASMKPQRRYISFLMLFTFVAMVTNVAAHAQAASVKIGEMPVAASCHDTALQETTEVAEPSPMIRWCRAN